MQLTTITTSMELQNNNHNTVFMDATALCALNNPRDQYASSSQRILQKLEASHAALIATDYVIDEAATLLLTHIKGGFWLAKNLLDWVLRPTSTVTVEWIDSVRFREAADVFRRFNRDKQWSFTDCTSYVVMKERKIKTAFSFDEHFREMGMKLL